ncbi:MAG: anion permease [Pseudomonadota bacterium]|jgi:PiT family inorganic phosphate transporter
MLLSLVITVIIVALIFDFINGFHDTANAIATVVSTGVLPLRTAIMLAAVLNFVGALTGTAVASTIGKGVITPDTITLVVVLSALLGAIFWNLFTWYFGIPSSSSHAMVGGLLGAGIAHSGIGSIQGPGMLKIFFSLILSPLVGMLFAFLMMLALYWLFRRAAPVAVSGLFRKLQMLSAGFMALSHGSNDAQKTMGVITMALVAYGAVEMTGSKLLVPTWVVLASAAAMGLGTAAGGVRIIKTLGTKIIDLKPVHGFAAETAAAGVIFTASSFGLPVSTTHCISGAIMGVGASQSVSAVRWGITVRILYAWVLTIPISALSAYILYWPATLLTGLR